MPLFRALFPLAAGFCGVTLTLRCTPPHTDLIVITFWVSLAFFVMLLFLILLYMSWSGSSQVR